MSDKPVLTHQQIGKIADKQFKEFKGDMREFESAIGALIIGQQLGWKVLLLAHDRRTIDKYGKILGVDFRESMPEVGELADKSMAWKAVQKVGNFWKAVKGEIKDIKTPALSKT